MTFQTSMSAFAMVAWNTLSEHQFFTLNFVRSSSSMFILLLLIVEVQNTICNSLITSNSRRNLNKIGWSKLHKIGSFFTKAVYDVNHFLTYRWRHFERGFCKWTIKRCWSIYHKTSIFHYSKKYGSLTRETWLKVAVNLEDLTCLLKTVRILTITWKFTNLV